MPLGLKAGTVTSVNDPENIGRVEVQIAGGPTLWAKPCVPHAGKGRGFYVMPEQGDGIWVAFEDDDLQKPVWLGCFWLSPGDLEYESHGGLEDPNIPFFKLRDMTFRLGKNVGLYCQGTMAASSQDDFFINSFEGNAYIAPVKKLILQSFDEDIDIIASAGDIDVEAKKGELSLTATGIAMGGWPMKFKAGDASARKIKELEDRIVALEAGT